jgi:hypothetical protein
MDSRKQTAEAGMEQDHFLQEQQTRLTDMLRPYQRELTRRQRLADFVNACIRSVSRDDFFTLYELLQSRTCSEVEAEAGCEEARDIFNSLRDDATRKVERSQLSFQEDFTRLAQEAGLPVQNDFPRLRLLQGIELEVEFAQKRTLINSKPLKTVDPQRIMRAVLALKRRLYDRPFEPQGFIDGLYKAYHKVIDGAEGSAAPIQTVYFEYTLSIQSRSFFQDMAKGKFREYDADQFAVDFWRYFTSDVSATSEGHVLRLTPGRNNAMWLIDTSGERRRITSLSFQRGE